MSSSLFGGGVPPSVNVNGSLIKQSFTGTANQTIFDLTLFSYQPGTNSLEVFINGQRQVVTRDFVETSATRFTLNQGVVVGDFVDVIGLPAVVISQVPTGVTGTATFPGATTIAVVFAVPQVDTNYKILLGPAANKTFWWTVKTVNGFLLSCSVASTDTIDWAIAR